MLTNPVAAIEIVKLTSPSLISLQGCIAMGEDGVLKRIRGGRLKELMKRFFRRENKKTVQRQGESALNKPVEVTDATFAKLIQDHPLVVIDCWAPWCAPCHMIAPVIEEMARDYAGRILFGKLNVDENRRVAAQYRIMGIPTLLVFKKGELADQIIGAVPRQTLEPRITRYLK